MVDEANQDRSKNAEVYRNIRKDANFELSKSRELLTARGKAFSSNHIRRCVGQLFRSNGLVEAFDLLLDIPGIWDEMRMSTIHKLKSMKYDEASIQYLVHIRGTWLKIVQGVEKSLAKIDIPTVKDVACRCPRYSTYDADYIRPRIIQGQIFSQFDPDEREAIWKTLCEIDNIIPSLFTFFRDVLLLQAWVDSMRHLVPLGPKPIHMTLQNLQGDYQDDPKKPVDKSTRRLWIYAMQNHQKLSQQPRRSKEKLLAKVPPQRADNEVLVQFAILADKLGFRSKEILDLKNCNRRLKMGDTETPLQPVQLCVAEISSRCGYPTKSVHNNDSNLLSLENFHFQYNKYSVKDGQITSFFVARSKYLAFFGELGEEQTVPKILLNNPPQNEQSSSEISEGTVLNRGLMEDILELRREGTNSTFEKSTEERPEWDSTIEESTDDESTVKVSPSEQIDSEGEQSNIIAITFVTYQENDKEDVWREFHKELVQKNDTSALGGLARRFILEHGLKSWNIRMEPVPLEGFFDNIINSGSHFVILLPQDNFSITDKIVRATWSLRAPG